MLWNWLSRLNPGPSSSVRSFTDVSLGVLEWNEDIGMWEAVVQKGGVSVSFAIAGSGKPSEMLLGEAAEILRGYATFRGRVLDFLRSEAIRIGQDSLEICELRIEQIVLSDPDHPERGMIYFDGPDEDRVWRCDILSRIPRLLGFDD